jgi:uncharacterized membrane protein
MNWLLDRILLVVTAVAFAGAAWAFYHYTGQWATPILLTIGFVTLFVENHRLRKLLKDNGINPRPNRRTQQSR